jgi:hypothetical protein
LRGGSSLRADYKREDHKECERQSVSPHHGENQTRNEVWLFCVMLMVASPFSIRRSIPCATIKPLLCKRKTLLVHVRANVGSFPHVRMYATRILRNGKGRTRIFVLPRYIRNSGGKIEDEPHCSDICFTGGNM